ncbi:hypothetical protein DFJ73DRAFT_178305 [Zopfochytrium polystomum]|nr:hypothetical protein DFJ73DRAFT_178305 [Zopfochytrium polystomum]
MLGSNVMSTQTTIVQAAGSNSPVDPTTPTTQPPMTQTDKSNNAVDPMFTIIVGHGDGESDDGGTMFELPASTFSAFPGTLLHDRTHRILQFRDPHLIRLPDCSPVVFRRAVLPLYDMAQDEWHVPLHLGFATNVLLSARTFLGRLVEAVDVCESSGNEDGDHDLEEAGELSPARINHDLQFLGIPSPFDPCWSFSVFAWTANGRAALQRMGPALQQIERAQKEAAETTGSWISMIKEFNAIWPLPVGRMADTFTESKMAGQTEEEHHTELQDQDGQSEHPHRPEQEESSCSDQDNHSTCSTSSDTSSTPEPVALIATPELQEALNSFFRVDEMAEAAEELMKKWKNEAWTKTRTVLDKLFGLQNVYFRRMDLADKEVATFTIQTEKITYPQDT